MIKVSLLAAAAALAACSAAHAELFKFNQAGTVRIDGGAARDATLAITCSPDAKGGALSIELVVPEANTRKDFDYDDFEGPDAPALEKALSHLVWSGAYSAELTHAASGWYAPEPPESFMFGITQMSHQRKPPAKLLDAVASGPGKLVWTQTGYDKATRQLVATFDFDAATATALHTAVVRCLPINSPKNPAAK
jgi:hypothetical protein